MGNIFKPILFSTEMVQAILNNEKTQTRRTKGLDEINKDPYAWRRKTIEIKGGIKKGLDPNIYLTFYNVKTGDSIDIANVYNSGDILWVRETSMTLRDEHLEGREGNIYYKTEELPLTGDFLKECGYKWTPAIHMKKTACRLFLRVKSVRIELLQCISESDCIAEGASDRLKSTDLDLLKGLKVWTIPSPFTAHQFGFLALWCKINGCESWISNPWVWVIEFERIDKPEDFLL